MENLLQNLQEDIESLNALNIIKDIYLEKVSSSGTMYVDFMEELKGNINFFQDRVNIQLKNLKNKGIVK